MHKTASFGIGVCGLGTVGAGVVNLFNSRVLTTADCQLVAIGARRHNPACDTSHFKLQDIFTVARDPAVAIVVELIGGIEIAKELIIEALRNRKHVVTANKALIAEYGDQLLAFASEQGVALRYEAAVAGGIPIISVLQHHLNTNDIKACTGVINGTSNFILTKMHATGVTFKEALQIAKMHGYAEADPTFDIDGTDVAHKLAIIIRNAFGHSIRWQALARQPLQLVGAKDAAWAKDIGYVIKLIGRAVKQKNGIAASVYPMLVRERHIVADINGTMNGLLVHSEPLGESFYYGDGAGSGPTASSVVADILNIIRDIRHNATVEPIAIATPTTLVPFAEQEFAFYWYLSVPNRIGVLAEVANIASSCRINIEALMQKESTEERTSVIILTFPVRASAIQNAQTALLAQDREITAHYLPVLVDY